MSSAPPAKVDSRDQVNVFRLLPFTLLGGLIFAAVERTQIYLSDINVDRSRGYLWGLGRIQPPWLILAALAPFIIWLAHRQRIVRPHRARALAIHTVASFVFTYAHLGLLAVIHYAVLHEADTIRGQTVFLAGVYLIQDIFAYWALVGATHAWMFREALRRREIDEARLRSQLTEAQLENLRRQVHPHFLFNTLNSVSMLARAGDSDAVVRLVADLSGLLRYSLRTTADEVPLADEMAFVQRYFAIARVRFGDRLSATWDVARDAQSALVPGLILQPLVENAIHHGVSRVAATAQIVVRARRENGSLLVEVEDDGDGRESAGDAGGVGIGLRNVRARLDVLYGELGILDMSRVKGGGTVVRLAIPFKAAPISERDM